MFTSEKMVKFLQEKYPPGTRIRLVSMDDPYAPVAPGTEGTLVCVDDAGQFQMKWDNGRTLALKLLFKLVVEHNMTNHLLGGDIDMTRDEYNKMRGNSVREVAGTHGSISFRDVLLFHREE